MLGVVLAIAATVTGVQPAGAEGESVRIELPTTLAAGGLSTPVTGFVRNDGGTSYPRATVDVTVTGPGTLRPEHLVLEIRPFDDHKAYARVPFTGNGTLQARLAPDGLPLPAGHTGVLQLRVAAAEGAPLGDLDIVYALRSLDGAGATGTTLGGGRGTVTVTTLTDPVSRLAGLDRFRTAASVSRAGSAPDGSHGAVLARADVFADALAATPLAVAVGGPLLLTGGVRLDPVAADELRRVLMPGATVHLVGGTAALGEQVLEDVRALGFSPKRLAGADRYATAVAVASSGLQDPGILLLSTGDRHPDALAAGAAAGHIRGAVLLTDGSRMPDATATYLARRPAAQRYAVGGPAAAADRSARAVAGVDRYDTAVQVAETFFATPTAVGLASGVSFADALSGGADAASRHAPLLLTEPDTLSGTVDRYLGRSTAVAAVALYGGTAAVSDNAAAAARKAVS